jgi:hypothetical protein
MAAVLAGALVAASAYLGGISYAASAVYHTSQLLSHATHHTRSTTLTSLGYEPNANPSFTDSIGQYTTAGYICHWRPGNANPPAPTGTYMYNIAANWQSLFIPDMATWNTYTGYLYDFAVPGSINTDALCAANAPGYPPAITSASSTTFSVSMNGSFTVTTTGHPTNTITNASFGSCTPSTLPGTVSFHNNGNNTATISGTPSSGSAGSYTLCLNATNGVGNPATQSFTLIVNPIGIDFANSTSSGTFGCVYTTITAVTCSLTGLGNGGATVSGTIRIVGPGGSPITNTGSAISVSYSLSGKASMLTPASPQSIPNGSSATPTISFKMDNGSNKTATLTATVTLNGATYTVTLTASS